ncbi:MAG: hypothetical protein F6J86_26330 [Symploca sp. SIO1B1]|nr:hypothetical protein [Symploca sp. SIO1B1]
MLIESISLPSPGLAHLVSTPETSQRPPISKAQHWWCLRAIAYGGAGSNRASATVGNRNSHTLVTHPHKVWQNTWFFVRSLRHLVAFL